MSDNGHSQLLFLCFRLRGGCVGLCLPVHYGPPILSNVPGHNSGPLAVSNSSYILSTDTHSSLPLVGTDTHHVWVQTSERDSSDFGSGSRRHRNFLLAPPENRFDLTLLFRNPTAERDNPHRLVLLIVDTNDHHHGTRHSEHPG